VGPVDDDAVFGSVQALVASGQYLDGIPGRPVRFTDGGWIRRAADDHYRRIYQRGTPEYLRARQDGLVGRLPALLTAPADAVTEAENLIGYPLPPLLRRLYLEVGNGGFGPGYGILGLRGGHHDGGRRDALDLYREAHDTPSSAWSFLPEGLLPVCHWGCGIYSFVDCSQPQGPIWGWDPNPGPMGREALFRQPFALAEWLDRWVHCQLCQPALVCDPDTQQWRGATEQEYAQWVAEMDEPAN